MRTLLRPPPQAQILAHLLPLLPHQGLPHPPPLPHPQDPLRHLPHHLPALVVPLLQACPLLKKMNCVFVHLSVTQSRHELKNKFDKPCRRPLGTTMSSLTYAETIQAIKEECSKINLTYSKKGDGRITSAVKEPEYLDKLEAGLKAKYPSIEIVRPKERFWYDIEIASIPINLKLTTGKTDDAFNKRSIVATVSCSSASISQNTNFNKLYDALKSCVKSKERNLSTEYHYLAVHKNTGTILLKSILDIHSYKSNPSNILQINWDNEFNNMEYACNDFKAKIRELLKTIQTSLKKQYENSKKFIEADIEKDFA